MNLKKQYIFFLIKKRKFINTYNIKIKKKNKIKINNIINLFIINILLNFNFSFFYIKNIIKTILLLFKKKKKFFLFLKNSLLKKIIENIFSLIKKKINIIVYFINFKIIKNFKKIIINNCFLVLNNNKIKLNLKKKKINFFFYIKNKIKFYLINKYKKKVIKIINKFKKKNFYNEMYQESILILSKIIIENNFNYKKIKKQIYWKIKILILFFLKKKKKNKIISLNFLNEKFKYISFQNNFIKKYEKNILINIIKKIILSFSYRDQIILRLRFGIGIKKKITLEKIGFFFSLTKERVRQLEFKLVLKIKEFYRSESLNV